MKYFFPKSILISRKALYLLIPTVFLTNCGSSPDKEKTDVTPSPDLKSQIELWLTKGDESVLLKQQDVALNFESSPNTYPNIEVDGSRTFQSVDGFGFTLTGGSAMVINGLSAEKKANLLKELFGNGDEDISINYLRLSIGASDLDPYPYTYNDLENGETDINLDRFSLRADQSGLIPLLKEILAIEPSIKILATPWSPPVWMKDNNSFMGGSLQPKYYEAYANYFVKYIQAMKAEGIIIDAITPQNEPLHPGNVPSLSMTAAEQVKFIKNNLGPAFKEANITTKIIIYDHNCDKPEYPIAILDDLGANPFIDGSAFHLYAGDISALNIVRDAHPDKNVYFTEQYTASTGEFKGDLKWHLKNVIIGSMRNWSKTALEWNLANNSTFGPHTEGGCTTCLGAITIGPDGELTRNVGYYIIAHASKFIPKGSIRIWSTIVGELNNVAFKTPKGKKVLIVENHGETNQLFNIKYNNKWVMTALDAGAVGTYIWD